jgi:hypothetical protein
VPSSLIGIDKPSVEDCEPTSSMALSPRKIHHKISSQQCSCPQLCWPNILSNAKHLSYSAYHDFLKISITFFLHFYYYLEVRLVKKLEIIQKV